MFFKWSRHRFVGLTIVLTNYSIAFLERQERTHTHTMSIALPQDSILIHIHIFSCLPCFQEALTVFSCLPSGGCSTALPPGACDAQSQTLFWEESFFSLSFWAFHPSSLAPSPWEALRRGVPKRPISKFLPHLHPDDRCENWAGASINAHARIPASSGAACRILTLIGYGFLITS